MELMLDTVNLKAIENYSKTFPIVGITSNPSIIKKEGKVNLFKQLKKIQRIIGETSSLHVQTTSDTHEEIIEEAYKICESLGKNTYVKIPINEEGLRAIQTLKREKFNITATGIYTMAQGNYAILSGADYIAPYFNRMENININASSVIQHFSKIIKNHNMKTKILAASFKNIGQVMDAYENGAHCATVNPELLGESLRIPFIQQAVTDFKKDWEDIYGKNVTLLDL